MSRIMGTFTLAEALKAEGFPLPDNCREARLVMGVHTAFVLQFDVFVTEENLARLGRAFQRMAEEQERERERARMEKES